MERIGPPTLWRLLGKVWDDAAGFMRSTKAMDVPGGVVIQVSHLQRNLVDGVSSVVSDALVFVPGAAVSKRRQEDGTYRLVKPGAPRKRK